MSEPKEPSKEALAIARASGLHVEDNMVELAEVIDALCAERVNAALEHAKDHIQVNEYQHLLSDREMRMIVSATVALTAQCDRLKEALNQILTYATVRGLDYEPTEIARAALKEVSDVN